MYFNNIALDNYLYMYLKVTFNPWALLQIGTEPPLQENEQSRKHQKFLNSVGRGRLFYTVLGKITKHLIVSLYTCTLI